MAKAPEFQPILNQPSFRANVKEPIVSRMGGAGFESATGVLKDVAKVAVEEYQSSQVQGLRKQTEQNIQDYLATSPTRIRELEVEAAGLENAMKQFTQVPAPEGVTGEQIDMAYSGVQEELNKRLDMLRRAKEQGLVTGTDFTERVLKSTREAVAKNPGITRELLSAASQTLEIYGIQDRIRRDDALIKAQQDAGAKMQTELWNEADKRNIPVTYLADGTVDYDTLQRRIMKNRADAGAYTALDQISKTNTILDNDEVRDLVRNGLHYAAVTGAYNDVQQKVIAVFNDAKIPYANKVVTAKSIINEAKGKVRQGFSRYMGQAEIKEAASFFESQVDHLETSLESFKSGDDAKKFFSNEKTIMEDEQTINLLKGVDVARYKFFANILQTAGFANLAQTKDGQEFINNLVILSKDMLRDANPSANNYNKDPNARDSHFGVLLKNHLDAFTRNDFSTKDDFDKTVLGYIKGLKDPNVTSNPTDYFLRTEDLVKVFSDPKYANVMGTVSAEARGQLMENLATYSDQLALSMAQYIRTHPEENITLNVLKDGTMVATGASPQFNRDFISRINTTLGAYANVNGVSKSEASKTFYEEHFREAVTNPDGVGKVEGSNNPLNIMSRDGRTPEKYPTFEAGITATYTQLKRYFDGQGPAQGVPRQTVTDIINLWRPASARRGPTDIAQDAYIGAVSKEIGVGPRQKIDLNDPVLTAKLITAMARIEGNPVTMERVFNALPNKTAKMPKNLEVFDGKSFEEFVGNKDMTNPSVINSVIKYLEDFREKNATVKKPKSKE